MRVLKNIHISIMRSKMSSLPFGKCENPPTNWLLVIGSSVTGVVVSIGVHAGTRGVGVVSSALGVVNILRRPRGMMLLPGQLGVAGGVGGLGLLASAEEVEPVALVVGVNHGLLALVVATEPELEDGGDDE